MVVMMTLDLNFDGARGKLHSRHTCTLLLRYEFTFLDPLPTLFHAKQR